MIRTRLPLALAGALFTLSLARPSAGASAADAPPSPLALAVVTADLSGAPRLEAIRHYPRRPRPVRYQEPRRYRSSGFSQIHGGVFDPDGAPEEQWLFGFRAGSKADAVQVGVGADLGHRSFTEEVVVAETVDPTGHVITTTQETFSTSSNWVPMMAFIQVAAPDNLPLRPYFGVGGGYELLFLSSEDFITGEEHDGVFHGWGWQAWGGARLPLGPRTSLAGELFANTATLRRQVDRFSQGQPVREEVELDGVGFRLGLQVGF